ncbi:ABC transporter substrate-binding protein [Mesorhizobium sp. 113-3-3]|uniref:ABC transporter substrate-binding protein n=1 Tax=Mesorhizobium sp. 113-3-3 TaxID=2744516 RepID=UPI001927B366|nr:transporter substrate-binding domain-containing protein [Mesorhizobium sp. 113-3-3]BCG82170.1 amino acid ABC transporter substrate-binding protein [Mesorhizobium sp. 113-3-3]
MSSKKNESSLQTNRRGLLGAGAMLAVGSLALSARRSSAAEAAAFDPSFEGFILNDKIQDDSLVRIQQAGVLRVGISDDPPYSFVDQSTGQYSGIEADIVQYIMKMLKIPQYKVDTVSFDGLIPGLLASRYDIIGDSMHYTAQRAKVVDFSFPTYFYAEWLMVPKGSPQEGATSIDSLGGRTIGSQLGNDYSEWLKATPGVVYKGYKMPEDMINDLRAGRIDGIIFDLPILAVLAKKHPEYGLVLAPNYKPRTFKNPAHYSRHIFRKEDVQFREAWSRALQWMQMNGKISEILDRYGLAEYSN